MQVVCKLQSYIPNLLELHESLAVPRKSLTYAQSAPCRKFMPNSGQNKELQQIRSKKIGGFGKIVYNVSRRYRPSPANQKDVHNEQRKGTVMKNAIIGASFIIAAPLYASTTIAMIPMLTNGGASSEFAVLGLIAGTIFFLTGLGFVCAAKDQPGN
jgi:hypothetical protein